MDLVHYVSALGTARTGVPTYLKNLRWSVEVPMKYIRVVDMYWRLFGQPFFLPVSHILLKSWVFHLFLVYVSLFISH